MTMQRATQLRNTGLIAVFLSGICAISTGVVVSLLQEMVGFPFAMTGMLLSCMGIGNMAASFISGMLPGKPAGWHAYAYFASRYQNELPASGSSF